MDEVFVTQLDRGNSFPIRLTYNEIKYLAFLLQEQKSPYAAHIRDKFRPFLKPETQAIDYADGNIPEADLS